MAECELSDNRYSPSYCLKDIVATCEHLSAREMDRSVYPELELILGPDEIAELVANKILTEDGRLDLSLSGNLNTPLEKLLYALA